MTSLPYIDDIPASLTEGEFWRLKLLNDLALAGLLRTEGNTRGRKYRLP